MLMMMSWSCRWFRTWNSPLVLYLFSSGNSVERQENMLIYLWNQRNQNSQSSFRLASSFLLRCSDQTQVVAFVPQLFMNGATNGRLPLDAQLSILSCDCEESWSDLRTQMLPSSCSTRHSWLDRWAPVLAEEFCQKLIQRLLLNLSGIKHRTSRLLFTGSSPGPRGPQRPSSCQETVKAPDRPGGPL